MAGFQTPGAPRSGYYASSLDNPALGSAGAQIAAVLGSAGLHAALLGLALIAGVRSTRAPHEPAPVTQMFEVAVAAPPVAPSEEPPAAPPLSEPAAPRPASVRVSRPAAKAAPPPSAAQAARVLTAADETLDFGDKVVTGQAAVFAGGVSASHGTAEHAVYDTRARAGGVEGGSGLQLGADASRPPGLAGEARWDCPFPEEADDSGVDRALVSLRVEIAADGGVRTVRATSDPGHGFAREARKCAEKKRWLPGLDRAGKPMHAVALVNVRFER